MNPVGIIGAGTMGSGIAAAAALAESDVVLVDINKHALASAGEKIERILQERVRKGKLPVESARQSLLRVSFHDSIEAVRDCQLVIEAIVEELKPKQTLFGKLDEICTPTTLLVTNTSSLPVTAIATAAKNRGRVIGLHFFNPPLVMKLVEVVRAQDSTEESINQGEKFVRNIGKIPVRVNDTPGFIVNRVARPFYGEALKILGEGIASVEEIDRIVREEGGFRMGPFELMDLIGIDVNFAVTKSMYEQFFGEPRYRPHPIQQAMVNAGHLGRKTRQGFYKYPS